MKNTDLFNFYKAQTGIFITEYEKAKIDYDEDAIHDFRVSVKRMKAVLRLLENIISDNSFVSKNNIASIKKIYGSAGIIRDSQVQVSMIKKYEKKLNIFFDFYKQYFNEYEKVGKKKFDFENKVFRYELLANEIDEIKYNIDNNIAIEPSNSIFDFVKIQYKYFIKLLNDTSNEENLHDARRKIKEINYVLEIVQIYTESIDKQLLLNLKRAGSMLGKWHDKVVMIENIEILEEFIKEQSNIDKYDRLKAIVRGESELILEDINNKLDAGELNVNRLNF